MMEKILIVLLMITLVYCPYERTKHDCDQYYYGSLILLSGSNDPGLIPEQKNALQNEAMQIFYAAQECYNSVEEKKKYLFF